MSKNAIYIYSFNLAAIKVKKKCGILSETSNKGEFKWIINSKELLETDDILYSAEFSFSCSSWVLQLKPNDKDHLSCSWFSISLVNKHLDIEKYVVFRVCINDITIENPCVFKNDLLSSNYFKLFDKGTASTLARHSDQLTLKIKLREFVSCDDAEYTLHKLTMKDSEILRQNYKDLLLSGEDHDLILKVKDREFKLHRVIMQCRCPVFKSMLTHEMLERNQGVVEIPDCDPCAFEQFIFYVYTGDLETIDESVMLDLYYIADKYDMPSVKEKCCEFIKKFLSARNIGDVIRLALKHSDSSLLMLATEYFIANVIEILETVEWQSFIKENPIQANELFIKTVKNCSCHLPKK